MDENIDLTKILKDCPKGWKFYSSILGDVIFSKIDNSDYPIRFLYFHKDGEEGYGNVSKEGLCYNFYNGECTINNGECTFFPSKNCRDWSKFTAPWYKKEESIKPRFKVGDRIRHKGANKNDVYEISKVYDDSYGIVGFTWMLCMKYQDQYELVPNKFDPKTLKAFDRVLARLENQSIWCCELFSFIEEGTNLIKGCGAYYKYCIPYNDGTKHLAGTTDEAPEYYRYWEK